MYDKKSVLIVVDAQKDFCEDGPLEVKKADEIMQLINDLLLKFSVKIGTQDWHPENHISFKSPEQGGVGWPKHCVAGTPGAKFNSELRSELFTTIIRKGMNPNKDAYSAFEDTGLKGMLQELKIKRIYVCGIALDYCVKATAIDAAKAGFETYVFLNETRAVDNVNVMASCEEMKEAGVKIIGEVDLFLTMQQR